MRILASLLSFVLVLPVLNVAAAESIVVHLAHHPGNQAAPYVVSWPSGPGQSYEVLATHDPSGGWAALHPAPIVATGAITTFTDRDLLNRRFYQVRRLVSNPGGEPPLSTMRLLPGHAALAPDGVQAFRAILPGGGAVVWTVRGFNGAAAGSISANGIYTAPPAVPDPPFVLIQANSAADPAQLAQGFVQLVPAGDLIITREQAIEVLLREVIESSAGKANMLALGLHESIDNSTRLRPFNPFPGSTIVPVPISGPSWFFMLDENPMGAWMHPVRYVVINGRTSAVEQNVGQVWYPELDGEAYWNSSARVESERDRVYAGAALIAELSAPAPPPPDLRPQSGDDFLAIHRIFPAAPAACDNSLPVRRYAVVAVMSPEEDKLIASANEWKRVFDANSFTTKLIANGSALEVTLELDRLRSVVRPTDVLVVFLLGHGIGGSVSGISSTIVSDALSLIPSSGKYLIMESCDAGHVFGIFQAQQLVPRVQILTASNIADPPNPFVGSSPLKVLFNGKSAFTVGLLSCLSRFDSLPEVHDCLTTVTEIGPLALRLKLADPQLRSVGDPDTDLDGVIDDLEKELGTDPAAADSDGDGICDGIEFGQLATLEKFNDDGTRDFAYSRGLKKARFTVNATLPNAVAANSYSMTLAIAQGVPFTRTAVGPQNPFGTKTTPPWALTQGSLPQGLAFDGTNGRISGTPTVAGDFAFEVTYTDAIGVKARRNFTLAVVPRAGAAPEITVSAGFDGNARDNDITLREAVLLASGKLALSELRPDPTPNNGISEGEIRWVFNGLPGAASQDSIRVSTSAGQLLITAPIVIEADGDDYEMRDSPMVGGVGPLLVIEGKRNMLSTTLRLKVSSGSALVVRGDFNYIGRVNSLLELAAIQIEGGGDGEGILVTGRNNWIGGAMIKGFATGVHFTGGAAENELEFARVIGNGEGILLEGGAYGNTIRDCAVGFFFEAVAPPTAAPNSGNGIVLSGGASSNLVVDCGVGANGGAGILIRDPETRANEIIDASIGSGQGFASTRGVVGPNLKHGIVIAAGASENRVAGGEVTSNTGHGILLTGAGTVRNDIGSRDVDGITIRKPDGSGDGVRIEDQASANTVSVEIEQSGSSGIVIAGSGTVSNRVTHRLFNAIYFPTIITNTAGPGLVIRDGASRNRVDTTRVFDCPDGILISGAGTRENILSGVNLMRNTTAAIRIDNGAEANRVEGKSSIQRNKTGLVIEGEGTRGNVIENCIFGQLAVNDDYAIELRNGARENMITRVDVQKQKLGGVLLTGEATRGNRVEKSRISGGLFTDEIPASGTGVILENGARGNVIAENIIFSNGGLGLLISGATTWSNRVTANRFTGNILAAVRLENAPRNTIGSASGAGNVILSHPGIALHITGAGASGNRVQGNQIGAADAFSRNASHGILIEAGAHGNTIGGALPQARDARLPQILFRPEAAERGPGNWIAGNGGDGIRISGANSNRVAGNLIGYSKTPDFRYGNGGDGVSLLDGASRNQIGNALPPGRRNPGYGNHITQNRGAGVRVTGASSAGNSVLQNRINANTQAAISLTAGGNANLASPDASIDIPAAQISGTSTTAGYLELFSSSPADPGVYHLTAYVGRGDYLIDQLEPGRCRNASILESDRPIRYGLQQMTFTDVRTGSSSAQVEFLIPAPGN